jgi:hypothetical protein
MFSYTKLLFSGSKLEIYIYSSAIEHSFQKQSSVTDTDEEKSEIQILQNRISSINRSKNTLKNLIYANAYQHLNDKTKKPFVPIFVTFTFKENITDLNIANRDFALFIKRLNYVLEEKALYLAVPEFQKRGAVHYHVVFFNVPFLKRIYDLLTDIWGLGFINVKSVNNLQHLANYVSKYISKDFINRNEKGARRYYPSRALKKSLLFRNDNLAYSLLTSVPPHLTAFEQQKQNKQTKHGYYHRIMTVPPNVDIKDYIHLSTGINFPS